MRIPHRCRNKPTPDVRVATTRTKKHSALPRSGRKGHLAASALRFLLRVSWHLAGSTLDPCSGSTKAPVRDPSASMSCSKFSATAWATSLMTWPAWRRTGLDGSCKATCQAPSSTQRESVRRRPVSGTRESAPEQPQQAVRRIDNRHRQQSAHLLRTWIKPIPTKALAAVCGTLPGRTSACTERGRMQLESWCLKSTTASERSSAGAPFLSSARQTAENTHLSKPQS